MATRMVVLSTYKKWMRAINKFPEVRLHSKMKFNVREVFELYKREEDPVVIDSLLHRGCQDLEAFSKFEKLDREDLDILLTTGIVTEREREIIGDLPEASYSFPPTIALTDERPDIIIWDASTVHLVELTVPFETGMVEVSQRKQDKHSGLVAFCRENRFTATLTTIQVGSRGFLGLLPLDKLYKLVRAPGNHKKTFERKVVRRTVTG